LHFFNVFRMIQSRREFFRNSGLLSLSILAKPNLMDFALPKKLSVGVQLYSVRKEMLSDAVGTLKALSKLGYKEIESASSEKGNYYGLSPKEIRTICEDLGMKIRSGHVQINDNFQKYIDQASETGQEYLICSSFSNNDSTIENYKAQAERLNKAGEACKNSKIQFGYHNHAGEFDKVGDTVLYDVLLENTDPKTVVMEMDLGWVITSGNNPLAYFKKHPGRFPLWHLKDMNVPEKHSVEFGKGTLPIAEILENKKLAGMKHFFVEQEEYASTALESLEFDIQYLNNLGK